MGSTHGVISTPHVCYINPVILTIICLWHLYSRSDELSSRISDKAKHYVKFGPTVYPTNYAPASVVLSLCFMGWFDFYTHVLPECSIDILQSHTISPSESQVTGTLWVESNHTQQSANRAHNHLVCFILCAFLFVMLLGEEHCYIAVVLLSSRHSDVIWGAWRIKANKTPKLGITDRFCEKFTADQWISSQRADIFHSRPFNATSPQLHLPVLLHNKFARTMYITPKL